jgi:hypothetical protein
MLTTYAAAAPVPVAFPTPATMTMGGPDILETQR